MKVKFKGWDCLMVFGLYAEGKALSMQLLDASTWEPVAKCTVNVTDAIKGAVPSADLPEPYVYIKDYSDNEGMVKALIAADIIEDKPINEITNSHVVMSAYPITGRALAWGLKEMLGNC